MPSLFFELMHRGCRRGFRSLALLMAIATPLLAATRNFDIPAGPALENLGRFSSQSGEQLIYATETVRNINTQAVRGAMAPRDALERMLAGTPLSVAVDASSGALSVVRGAPNDGGATQQNSGVRPQPRSTDGDTTVRLSPFEVRTERDQGYVAASTLAGSRLNTSLIDTPAAVSVMTREFLDDIGATNVSDALVYSMNAERDTTDTTGNNNASQDTPLKIRGFRNGSLARNYFGWGLESDTYNTERLDFSRGPNSVLFGTGGPGGIINTTTKRALFGRDVTQLGVRVGAWDEYRGTLDVSRQIGEKLAVRVNLLEQRSKSWRDFLTDDRKGAAFAVTARPFRNTEIRFDGEYGDYRRFVANPFLTGDSVTRWIYAGRPRSQTYGAVVPGTRQNANRALVHDPDAGTVLSWFGSVETEPAGIAPSITWPYSMTDFSIWPLSNNLGGEGNRIDNQVRSGSLFIEQRLGDLLVEVAGNRRESDRFISNTVWSDVNFLRADPNALLPDGRPNPNFGRLYVESNARPAYQDNITEELRVMAAYTLDLKKRNEWLGEYAFSGMWSDSSSEQRNATLFEVNLTPAGTAAFPANVSHVNNRIFRRVYLDAFGPGRRGGVDPNNHLLNQNGVRSGFVVAQQAPFSRTDLESRMVALQAKLLKVRLVLTGGLRRDTQKNFSGIPTVADPATGFPRQSQLNPNSTDYSGDTETFGSVLHVTPWLSLFYNRSNNFSPQSGLTIFDEQLGPRIGEGQDMGIKLRLLDGRLYASINRYETDELNGQVFPDGTLFNAIREIQEAITGLTPTLNTRDGIDTVGEGYEVEIVANLTSQWRLAFNVAQTEGTQSNNSPRIQAYIAANRAAWTASGSRPLVAPITGIPTTDPVTGGPATVQTALRLLDEGIVNILGQNGVTQRQLREYTGSLFSTYTFEVGNRWLNGLSVGAGVRYRGKPVVGYVNGRDPIFGDSEVRVDMVLKKNVRVLDRRVRLQANLENLLDEDDPIVADADLNGAYRHLYPSPFRWRLSATLDF